MLPRVRLDLETAAFKGWFQASQTSRSETVMPDVDYCHAQDETNRDLRDLDIRNILGNIMYFESIS